MGRGSLFQGMNDAHSYPCSYHVLFVRYASRAGEEGRFEQLYNQERWHAPADRSSSSSVISSAAGTANYRPRQARPGVGAVCKGIVRSYGVRGAIIAPEGPRGTATEVCHTNDRGFEGVGVWLLYSPCTVSTLRSTLQRSHHTAKHAARGFKCTHAMRHR